LCAFIQLNLNQWEAAEQKLQAAIRSDSAFPSAYVVLGDLYNRELRFDDALATMEQAVALIPDSWLVHYEIARALIGKHQYDLALTISDAALRNNHGTLLHIARAHALAGLKRYPQAIAELRAYLHYQPVGEGSQQAREMLRQTPKYDGSMNASYFPRRRRWDCQDAEKRPAVAKSPLHSKSAHEGFCALSHDL
jgi:tetratricopeptide (TPR) repeat protein